MELRTRQLYNQMMTGMAQLYGGHYNGADKFSIDPIAPELEQRLEARIRESSDLLKKINVASVRDTTGEKLGMGTSRRIASRTDTEEKDRETKYIGDLTGRKYELFKTDFDHHMRYQTLDNWSSQPNFEAMYRDQVMQQIAEDRVTVGWNGVSAEKNTDIEANPQLEDLNRGWLQAVREDRPENMLGADGTPIRIGGEFVTKPDNTRVYQKLPGAMYATIDEAVFDISNRLLAPWYRTNTKLRVILGTDLYHGHHMQMLNDNLSATERNAREEWLKNNTIGGRRVEQEEFFPTRGLLITPYDNLSIYYQRNTRRRTIVDNAKRDRIEDYQSVNEGYIVEDYDAICGIDHLQLQLPDGQGGWQ